MRPTLFAVLPVAAALAACQPVIPSTNSTASQSSPSPAALPGEWEAVAVTGSRNVSDDILKINVATGAAWIHCCGSNNNSYWVIKDTAQLPAGDYHLVSWSHVSTNGDVNWNAYRFDRKTGHTWVIESENGSYSWLEVNTTIAFQ